MKRLLGLFGYYKIDYGYSAGRHWIAFNGKHYVYQGEGADLFAWDEVVKKLQDLIFHGIGCRRIEDRSSAASSEGGGDV